MKVRLNYGGAAAGIYDAMGALDRYLDGGGLTLAVATINAGNRLSVAARLVPGTCQPATRRDS